MSALPYMSSAISLSPPHCFDYDAVGKAHLRRYVRGARDGIKPLYLNAAPILYTMHFLSP